MYVGARPYHSTISLVSEQDTKVSTFIVIAEMTSNFHRNFLPIVLSSKYFIFDPEALVCHGVLQKLLLQAI